MLLRPLCLCAFSLALAASQNACAQSPLTTWLNKNYLTPVPAGLSTYKPGTLIILKPHAVPDPWGPPATVKAYTAEEISAYLPATTISTDTEFSLASTLFGFSPKAKFGSAKTLNAEQLVLNGWKISDDDEDKILAPGSPVFERAKMDYQRDHGSLLNWFHDSTWTLYLVKAVFYASSAKVSSTGTTQLNFSGDSSASCDDTQNSQAGGTQPKKSSTTSSDTSSDQTGTQAKDPKNSNGTNAAATDITATGNATASIIGAVQGNGSKKDDASSSTGKNSSSAKTIADILPVKLPSTCFTHKTSNSVTFQTQSPVPIAMILKEVTFTLNFESMTLRAETAKF